VRVAALSGAVDHKQEINGDRRSWSNEWRCGLTLDTWQIGLRLERFDPSLTISTLDEHHGFHGWLVANHSREIARIPPECIVLDITPVESSALLCPPASVVLVD
jgi:hypothetical protein